MKLHVAGIGLCGPGLRGWLASRAILSGRAAYLSGDTVVPATGLLPGNESRRAVASVKLALAVGAEALGQADADAATMATVFASSGGDGQTVHRILEALATEACDLSPTSFHNSVHNAPSGYWTIAVRSREPTTSLCCFDWSFAAGLLEAAAQVIQARRPVTLIAYDLSYPEPLRAARSIDSVFGTALVLAPDAGPGSPATLDVSICRERGAPTGLADGGLEAVRIGNPAARSLPILTAIARGAAETVRLDYVFGNQVEVLVKPCKGAPL